MFDNIPSYHNMFFFFSLFHAFRSQNTVQSFMLEEEKDQFSGYSSIAKLLLITVYLKVFRAKTNKFT